jgi:hypothetical protein
MSRRSDRLAIEKGIWPNGNIPFIPDMPVKRLIKALYFRNFEDGGTLI